ncbi:site-2 protease family protein [Candidatus Saccharibacteria bacterium]|nr:site-2 protease family protein [Candidatus Saccharibacteria bacterium]
MDITYIFVLIVIILISMTIHEAMHAFASYWLGDHTAKQEGRLTLNPIAHIDPFLTLLLPVMLAITGAPIFGGAKPVPFNPIHLKYGDFGPAIVAIAGPLTNLVLAFLGFVLFVLFVMTGDSEGVVGLFLSLFVTVNLGFFLFNMLPIPPLDGSRVLYAFAPDSARQIMEMIERYGIIFIFILVIFFSQYIGMFMKAGINFFLELFSALFGVRVL